MIPVEERNMARDIIRARRNTWGDVALLRALEDAGFMHATSDDVKALKEELDRVPMDDDVRNAFDRLFKK